MAKQIIWRIQTEDAGHIVTYTLHKLTGRMTVTLDGEAFDLSTGPLALGAARREPFRIVDEEGEAEQAVLVVDKKGRASLLFRAKEVTPES